MLSSFVTLILLIYSLYIGICVGVWYIYVCGCTTYMTYMQTLHTFYCIHYYVFLYCIIYSLSMCIYCDYCVYELLVR